MSGNSFGTLYCVTSFGESHGPAIGGVIEKHMVDTGFLRREELGPGLALPLAVGEARRSSCPRCGEQAVVFQEGCTTCLSCGYSKCS